MQLLWVMAALCCAALAAPDAGYSYPSPVNSHSFGGNTFSSLDFLLPSSGYSSFFGDKSPTLGDRSQFTNGYFYPAPTPSSPFDVPANAIGGGGSGGGGGGADTGDIIPFTDAPTLGGKQLTIDGGFQKTNRTLAGGFGGGGLLPTTEAPVLINKHVYFFSARHPPTTPPPPAAGRQSPPRQVHYKIIFVKAPSYQAQTQQVVQGPARDEHKTLIYVLVKKPDEAAAASAPTPAPTAPSRPEVYFIRYKARAQAAGHGDGPGGSYGVPARTGGPY